MSFASREKAIISQSEVGVGMVAGGGADLTELDQYPGGGPMARLPQLIGRNRALEVLLSSEDIRAGQAESYGYINCALPDAELDAFVEAVATRIARFDKSAIAKSGGWGYAVFNYDAASDQFTADAKSPSDCGYACHRPVKANWSPRPM